MGPNYQCQAYYKLNKVICVSYWAENNVALEEVVDGTVWVLNGRY